MMFHNHSPTFMADLNLKVLWTTQYSYVIWRCEWI